jgi:hypothetical protein
LLHFYLGSSRSNAVSRFTTSNSKLSKNKSFIRPSEIIEWNNTEKAEVVQGENTGGDITVEIVPAAPSVQVVQNPERHAH